MNEDAYRSVLAGMRLPGGLLFGLPVVLDTADDSITPGARLLLTYKGQEVGVMDVESRWVPNKVQEAKQCYGSTSLEHPAVQVRGWGRCQVCRGRPSGRCHGAQAEA